MKRVLLYLGIRSRKNLNSSATKRSWPDCSENTDPPDSKIVLAVAGPYPNHDAGTKEEAFFNTETWLESDCEDFFSVQGERTPSLNASPLHHKKSLRELLAESFDRREHIDPSILANERQEEEHPIRPQRRNPSGSGRYCFPGLVRSLSYSEWRKKRFSPAHC